MREMVCGVNQGIVVGEKVVTILEVRGDSVRLGISSPRAEFPNIYDYREETLHVELPDRSPKTLQPVR